MKRMFKYLRVEEWLTSKVTLMLGIQLLMLFMEGENYINAIKQLAVFFMYAAMFLAFSYVSNDLSDIEVDRMAGKKKVIAGLPRSVVYISLSAFFIIGNIGVILLSNRKVLCLILIILTYFFGVSYSALGIRFKEKGVWGLLECSFAQRCMPLFMILCLRSFGRASLLVFAGWMCISFFDGLRYILIHQYIDLENDMKSGVATFISEAGKNYRGAIISLFVAEIVLTILTLYPLWRNEALLLLTVLALYVFFEYTCYVVLDRYAGKDWFVTFDSVPLEAFYNIVFPILTGVCFAKKAGLVMVIYCIIIIVICLRSMIEKAKITRVYVNSKIKRR